MPIGIIDSNMLLIQVLLTVEFIEGKSRNAEFVRKSIRIKFNYGEWEMAVVSATKCIADIVYSYYPVFFNNIVIMRK